MPTSYFIFFITEEFSYSQLAMIQKCLQQKCLWQKCLWQMCYDENTRHAAALEECERNGNNKNSKPAWM